MTVCNRDHSTLSGTLRNFHDGKDQRNTTKANASKCTHPHLVMVCHVTSEELLKQVTNTDIANGFLNRFMICNVAQDKDEPNPKPVPKKRLEPVIEQIVEVIKFVEQGHSMTESKCFMDMFESIYSSLRSPKGPLISRKLLARSAKYARMLSMVFALMEQKTEITAKHLNTALFYIRYWWKSVNYIFVSDAELTEHEEAKELAEKVYEVIFNIHKNTGKCTKTDITRAFSNKKSKNEINPALKILLDSGNQRIIQTEGKSEKGGVKPKFYRPAK